MINPGIAGVFYCPRGLRHVGFYLSSTNAWKLVSSGRRQAIGMAHERRQACSKIMFLYQIFLGVFWYYVITNTIDIGINSTTKAAAKKVKMGISFC